MAAHAIWGFFMWSLMLTPPQPTPQSKCPEDTRERRQCTPTVKKEFPLSQGSNHGPSGQKEALTCTNKGTRKECVLS